MKERVKKTDARLQKAALAIARQIVTSPFQEEGEPQFKQMMRDAFTGISTNLVVGRRDLDGVRRGAFKARAITIYDKHEQKIR